MTPVSIHLGDIEELQYSVDPWDLCMTQMSTGDMQVEMQVLQLDGLFISSEFWSKKIVADGLTPLDYIVLAGTVDGGGFAWCGERTSDTELAFANSGTEIGFVTRDNEHHWTLLLPIETALDQLGEEVLWGLPKDQRFLLANRHLADALSSAIMSAFHLIGASRERHDLEQVAAHCRLQILAACSRLLMASLNRKNPRDGKRRQAAYNRAVNYVKQYYSRQISVSDLASCTGVSRRTLELAFKQVVGISPATFVQRYRLNMLHRQLMHASPDTYSVTEAAYTHGLAHLGRTAGFYRNLFGESPSETLHSIAGFSSIRFSDVLQRELKA